MKPTFLLGLLASTSLASARIHSGTHAFAVAASLLSSPLAALAVPVWTPASSRFGPRQANSTTSAVAGTYTVALGDTLRAIAAAGGITTQQLEDANPGVVPTELQVGEVLNLPASANSNATSTSGNAPAATQSNGVDASDFGEGVASASPPAHNGTTDRNTTSSCGGHHHHHNGTATGNGQSQNKTTSTGHHTHNGTTTDDNTNNSTSVATGSGVCTAHHHHNGTAGTTAAASFFIPATATASALAVALTPSAASGNVERRALGRFPAILHRI
jgi:LysM repeat protein